MSEQGLRERKKQQTRAALIDAGVRMFRRRGFDAVTIEEICGAADVSPRTFFRYFEAKEQIVLHDVDVYKEAFAATLRSPRAGESAWATARRAALAVAREIADRSETLRPRLLLVPQSPMLVAVWAGLDAFWRDELRVHFERADLRDADMLAAAVVGGLNAALGRHLADPKVETEDVTSRVFELFASGRRKP